MSYADMTMTLEELSEWLSVPSADVAYTVSEVYALDLHDDAVPVALCGDLRSYFGERSLTRQSPR
ncbi:hypothetical protein [Pseudonocardia xishanensis]|uniref:Uncharacterized protein n=1 Tax=Pseudonocardia xishanensis TaxID=630995 RepID=A0ABP8S3W7_9PSEU